MLVFPDMNGNDPVTLEIPADPDAPAAALDLARNFAAAAGLSRDTSEKLAIIIEELVFNLIDHGAASGIITLSLAATRSIVALTLLDTGTPYDPRQAVIPSVIPDRGGGAGLALVLAWSSIVDYGHSDGRNRLELTLPR